jgi:2-keto-3-deoxy-L-rhamnonate aldolase RhmA
MDFRKKLAKPGPLLGMQCFSGSPALVEIMGHAGLDWVSLDMEHSPWDFAQIEHLARAANASNISPLVRVADNDPILIMKALDAGTAGVIVPHVNCRADLERAVASTLHPPYGVRGVCSTVRATKYGSDFGEEFFERVRREVVVVPLIEEKAGIEAFDDLLAVENVPVYWIGISDLAASLGIPGADFHHPQLAEIARGLVQRSKAANKDLMCTVAPRMNIEYAKYLMDLGFRLISYGVDLSFFSRSLRDLAAILRQPQWS